MKLDLIMTNEGQTAVAVQAEWSDDDAVAVLGLSHAR